MSGIRSESDRDYDYVSDAATYETSDDAPPGFQFWFGFDFAYYLTHTPIAPYLGAGVGMFTGGRVHVRERVDSNNDGFNDATDYHDSKLGVDIHPTVGLELVRHSSIRVHFEFRYACDFSERGRFGHGPLILAGIAF